MLAITQYDGSLMFTITSYDCSSMLTITLFDCSFMLTFPSTLTQLPKKVRAEQATKQREVFSQGIYNTKRSLFYETLCERCL